MRESARSTALTLAASVSNVSATPVAVGMYVLTYREIGQIAAEVLGIRRVTVTIPGGVLRGAVWAAVRLGERPASLARLFAEGLTQDAIGERYGDHPLDALFRELASAR